MSSHIIALGGGGFSTQTEPGLDTYLLRQSSKECPNIGFIGSASGDSESYLLKFYSRFSQLSCTPSHLALFRHTPPIDHWMSGQDIIFVGGGNTKSMLALWQEWDLPAQLRAALGQGKILAGISAGAICWFESGVTDSYAGSLRSIDCLGMLSGSCCPHYSDETDRRPAYHDLMKRGEISPGIAIDDGVAVHFIDGVPARIISARPDADAYHVSLRDGSLHETPIPDVERADVTVRQ